LVALVLHFAAVEAHGRIVAKLGRESTAMVGRSWGNIGVSTLDFARGFLAALFSRMIPVLIFWTITILVCAQTMFTISFVVGFSALAACALCYAAAAGFMGSLIARREKGYSATDLLSIGIIGLVIMVAGLVLMIWSGFSVRLFDIEMSGVTWALVGAISAVVVVRKEDALR
jgi:hypothetical protein